MLDKARFAFELVGVYRPKLPAPEVAVNALLIFHLCCQDNA